MSSMFPPSVLQSDAEIPRADDMIVYVDPVSLLMKNTTVKALCSQTGRVPITAYGAVGEVSTDSYAAFQAAITAQVPLFAPPGDYYLSAVPRVPNGGFLSIHAIPGTVRIYCAKDVPAFAKGTGANDTVQRIDLFGLKFMGEHDRGTTWPYSTPTSNYKMPRAFQIPAQSGDPDSICVIDRCEFHDFKSYPFQVFHFETVHWVNSRCVRCLDPGFLFCGDVFINNNKIFWSADNGLSVSRGCRSTIVTGNFIYDSEISGIWVAGYAPTAVTSSTLTITGTYTAGGSVTITSSSSVEFTKNYLNTYIVVTKGADTAVVKITGITSFGVATGIAVKAVPAALQGAASDSWQHAPGTGPGSYIVTGNHVIGAVAGVRGTTAAKHGTVANNILRRIGYVADSEVYTTGTIITGTNSLLVADGSIFAADDWIIVRPPNALNDYFIAKINSKSTNTLTLDRNAPFTFAAEPVHLCHVMSGGYGVQIAGDTLEVAQFAEEIIVSDNLVSDFLTHAFLGGNLTAGSVRKVSLNDNQAWQPGSLGAAGTRSVFRVNESTDQQSADIIVEGNETDDTSQFFAAYVRGTGARRFDVDNNYHPNITLPANIIAVYDADNANADISHLHNRPGNLSYIAGRSYALTQAGNSNNSVSAVDQVYLYPFYLDKPLTFNGGTIYVATAGTGSSVKAAIYANSPTSHRPLGAPLFVDNTGVATTSSSTAAALALGSGTLQPGWYWLATKHTGTLPVVQAAAAYNQFFNKYFGAASGSGAVVGLRSADSYSNNMPTFAEGASFTNQTAAVPVFNLTAA